MPMVARDSESGTVAIASTPTPTPTHGPSEPGDSGPTVASPTQTPTELASETPSPNPTPPQVSPTPGPSLNRTVLRWTEVFGPEEFAECPYVGIPGPTWQRELAPKPETYAIPAGAFGVEFAFEPTIIGEWPAYASGTSGTATVLVGVNWDEHPETTWNMAQMQWGFTPTPETYLYPVVNEGWGEAADPGGAAVPAVFAKCYTNNEGFETGPITLVEFTLEVTVSYLQIN